ncbi:MAG: hypothetical protein H7X71_00480 [Chitinophagales bacterium]|nr:hypothetical protein [Chitinophagales bacterium]
MKRCLSGIFGIILFISAHAQSESELDFIQSVGFSYYTNFLSSYPAIHYQPRLNFWEISSKAAVSLDVRFAGGYFEQNDSKAEEHYPIFDIPVSVNYNYGCAATRVSSKRIGYYGGIGWNTQIAYGEYLLFGPLANAGFRFDIDDKSPIDINAGFMVDISGNYTNEFMVGIQYVFGMLK